MESPTKGIGTTSLLYEQSVAGAAQSGRFHIIQSRKAFDIPGPTPCHICSRVPADLSTNGDRGV